MTMESLIDLLQWPAMLVTLIAAWLVGSRHRVRRCAGFLCFILSNVLWVIWGWHSQAWALIVLQLGLFAMNLRGTRKNAAPPGNARRSEEHTSELQSRPHLVCRLLLEKKKNTTSEDYITHCRSSYFNAICVH